MENNILVIGNGFDVAHGLETKYEQFLNYIKDREYEHDANEICIPKDNFKEIVERNGFIRYFISYTNSVPGWVDLEKIIKDIISCVSYFIENPEEIINKNGGHVYFDLNPKLFNIFEIFGIFTQSRYITGNQKSKMISGKYHNIYGINKREIIT